MFSTHLPGFPDSTMNTSEKSLNGVATSAADMNSTFVLVEAANVTSNRSSLVSYRYEFDISVLLILGYMSVFIVGLVGNSCVIWVVIRAPRMRTVTNYLIVNLACIDIIVLLVCVPSNLLNSLIHRK